MGNNYLKIEKTLLKKKDIARSKILARYFKTASGEYGAGDIFLGITVGEQRKLVKDFLDLSLLDIKKLLQSPYHEFRFSALLILTEQYKKNKKKIVDFYLKNTKYLNNWDLVDVSCYNILGDYLKEERSSRQILYKLAASDNLWLRRISMVSTLALIKNNELRDTFKLAKILLNDKHDLIQKANGWMLREAGKKDEKLLEDFLNKNISIMPRVTLRYAIEKFPDKKRKEFLSK